jgi:N-acetylglucosaminyldiphosphoundecaprenol N-acetyl-beta-D-mannosaminyltransferase
MTANPVSAANSIRGIRILNLALEEALCAIEAALHRQVRTCIAFVNADCVNIAARDAAYQADLAAMDWVFADGIGMRIAGKILGQPVRDNVNGTDLFPRLCESLAASGHGLYLLGARPGVAEAAAQWARSRYPDLRIVGCQHGYFDAEQAESVCERIRAASPDVLLVALGAPRQEHWMRCHGATSGARLLIGVGGLFDYYSGRIPRAPLWMRRLGLEWVFRLRQEPARLWRRYLIGNPAFLARIGSDRLRHNAKRHDHEEN